MAHYRTLNIHRASSLGYAFPRHLTRSILIWLACALMIPALGCETQEPEVEAAIHVIGIYESRSDHGGGYHPMGDTNIAVEETEEPIVLVLSSYEPTQWNVSGDIESIQEVIVTGYHAQIVTGVDPEIVDLHSYEDTGDYLFGEFRYRFDDEADEYLAEVETYANGKVASAQGDYKSPGSYTIDNSEPADDAIQAETHVIGIYESRSDHGGGYHPMGETDVVVAASSAPIILVLSSYEPTQWNLSGDIESIQEVIVTGYHAQIVTGVDPQRIDLHTYYDTGDYLFGEFRYRFDDEADAYLAEVEAYSGAPVASAQGDYRSPGIYQVGSDDIIVEEIALEAHIIGIYESRSDHSGGYHPTGTTDIVIESTSTPFILVLSSYEPTQWNLSGQVDAITEVIITGYHAQIVTGVDPQRIDLHTYYDTGDYLFGEFRYRFDSSADAYLAEVEAYAGVPVASAQGDYRSPGAYSIVAP